MKLEDSISKLTGIGPKKLKALESISIKTISELLNYFPRRYIDRNFSDTILLKHGEIVTLIVTVIDSYLAHGKRSRLLVGVKTKNHERISLVFFSGVNYFQSVFKTGMNLVISGKLEYFRGLQISHPDYEVISSETEEDFVHAGRIIPLYSLTESMKRDGIDSRSLRKLMIQIVDEMNQKKILISEILPKPILKKRNLLDRNSSYSEIHFPTDDKKLQEARKRFAYEEFYFFHLLMNFKKKEREKIKRKLWALPHSQTAELIEKKLPFELTPDQKSAIQKVTSLSKSDIPYACLLQGDVGSGKTITALEIALHYIDNDVQVVLLAPTEVLARQHYSTIQNLLSHSPFMKMDLFVGKEKEKTRKEKIGRLKSSETLLAIGTHTLFQDDIEFANLGLVIIDEQHKFGVEQRESIRLKGKNPDILAMTATPIPRTLSLTFYGDLELVLIKSKPKNRKEIQTKWIKEDKRALVYNSVKKYLNQGRQAFIIYPLVEESEKVDLESCIEAYERLKELEFKEYNVGLIHGKMPQQEKERVMVEFKKNNIHVLVATTVIEVGIDIPNANVLVIENADRYGISQLHQLRGRVGRGEHESFCIMITAEKVTDEATERLTALTQSNDGFYLAEVDLKLRGPGELLGLRQSGLPDFKVGDIIKDEKLVVEAREDVLEFGSIGDMEKIEMRNRFTEGRILFPN